ncbi:Leucine-rich repeat [Trinorchestia longiramus]|nr:Leucine-rich repeat [Trinorchestia longiramus]
MNVKVTNKNISFFKTHLELEENKNILEDTTCFLELQGRYVCRNTDALASLSTLSRSSGVRELRLLVVGGPLLLPSYVVPNLRVLDLTNSNTTLLAATLDLQNLEVLKLSSNPDFNPWSLLGVRGLHNLATLELSGVTISSPSNLTQLLGRIPKLRTLEMASCNIQFLEDRTFSQLKNLQVLNVSGNSIHELDLQLSLLHTLKSLDASRCQLENINVQRNVGDITGVQKTLEVIDVSHNQLAHVHPLLVQALVPTGAHIDVTGNPLNPTACSQYPLYQRLMEARGRGHSVVGGAAVSSFSLQGVKYCTWQDCPQSCVCDDRRKSVECVRSGLQSVPAIGPSETEILVLDHNSITDLGQIYNSVWRNLHTILINDNHLASLDSPHFNLTTLTTLSVNTNQLSYLHEGDCALLTAVEHLNISNNQLVRLDASVCGYLKVKWLDAAINYIKNIADVKLTSMPYIQHLNLSKNSITFVTKTVLDDLPFLQVLDLSYNHLKQVESPSTRQSLHRSLTTVYVNGNDLESLGPLVTLLLSQQDVRLDVKDNPMNCSKQEIFIHKDNALEAIREQCDLPAGFSFIKRWMIGPLVAVVVVLTLGIILTYSCLSTSPRFLRHPCGTHPVPVCVWVCRCVPVCVWVCRCVSGYAGVCRDVQKKYDLYSLHDCRDDQFVCNKLLPQLQQQLPGVQLLKCCDINLYGRPFLESFRQYVRECSKVLVVVSDASSKTDNCWIRLKLRACLQQQFRDDNFLVMALLMLDSPSISELKSDPLFNFIVEDRKFVHCGEGDYVREIKRFVGPVNTRTTPTTNTTPTDNTATAIMY